MVTAMQTAMVIAGNGQADGDAKAAAAATAARVHENRLGQLA